MILIKVPTNYFDQEEDCVCVNEIGFDDRRRNKIGRRIV